MNEHTEQPTGKSPLIFPNVGSCYSHGWKQMWKYFPESLLILLLAFVISIPSWGITAAEEFGMSLDSISPGLAVLIAYLYVLSVGYAVFIQGPLEFGISLAFLKAARNDRLKIMAMFEAFKSNYLHAILAGILYTFIIVIGFIFLIIPAIIWIALAFASLYHSVSTSEREAGLQTAA
jgi:uncharacterized membrane protein